MKPTFVGPEHDAFIELAEDEERLYRLQPITECPIHIVVLMQENRSFDQVLGYLRPDRGRQNVEDLLPPGTPGQEKQRNRFANRDFVPSTTDPTAVNLRLVMDYFDHTDLPVYDVLAREFAICDPWYTAHSGPTWPNRFVLISGDLNRDGAGTVETDDPDYIDLPPLNDDHPPADMADGQHLVNRIVRALMDSPGWERTLFVITYDKHGGFYDHVIHDRFDHTSIGATILRRFCGPNAPRVSPRMDAAKDLRTALFGGGNGVIYAVRP